MGTKWRVGDGKFIQVFKDNWLPGNSCGRVTSSPSDLYNNMCVADLIDGGSSWWNSLVIDEIFLPFEAQKIKAIPLYTTPQLDSFTGHGNGMQCTL